MPFPEVDVSYIKHFAEELRPAIPERPLYQFMNQPGQLLRGRG